MANDYQQGVIEAEQMTQEYAIGRVNADDAGKIGMLALYLSSLAGDAGADLDQLRMKAIMNTLEAAYRLGRAGQLRDLGETPADFYDLCSSVMADAGSDNDLAGFDDYIAGAM